MYSEQEATEATLAYFDGDELATSVTIHKYLMRNEKGELQEKTPEDMHWRIAREFARVEKNKFKQPLSEEQIFYYLDHFKYIIPQGSALAGIGNPNYIVSFSNCYVLESPEDSYGGIHRTDEQLSQISKRRGGTGLDISHLRPEGSPTKNSSKTSSGIVPFMERFSHSIREVGQNSRRGALMITISVHHPQVLDFARAKLDKTKVTGANVSIRLTDEFLKAVQEGSDYEQRWPVEGTPKQSKMVSAREVWKEIIKCAHEMAEPGLLFWDNILRESPADCYEGFKSVSTNPCCFSCDDPVWTITQDGIKEIKDISANDKIWINQTKTWERTSGYFKSGISDIYEVSFKNGDSIQVTNNHKLCKINSRRIETKIFYSEGNLVELSQLKVGDKIAIHNTQVNNINFGTQGSYDEGLILGWMTGDGCLCYHDDGAKYPASILDFWESEFDTAISCLESFKKLGYELSLIENKTNNSKRIRSEKFTEQITNKYELNLWLFKSETKINPFLFISSKEFIIGYLRTYFAADGTVEVNHESSGYNIQLSSINKNRLKQVQLILNLFGIKSSIGLGRKAGESEFINGGKYQTKDCWRLTITGISNIQKFSKEIGIENLNKTKKLQEIDKLIPNKTNKCNNYTEISKIERIGQKEVGCISVNNYKKFTANSIISGNSELPLCPLDSCRLLLQNLYSYVIDPFTENSYFNYDLFFENTKIAQRLMDDLVDLELEQIDKILDKIRKDPEKEELKRVELDLWIKVREKCKNGRRTGLGPTGLGDALAALGLKYGSPESIKVVDKIYEILKLGAYQSSVNMAQELGTFPIYDKKLEEGHPFLERLVGNTDLGESVYNKMKVYGRRNIALLTTAPAGTISILTQTTSGIEPLFLPSFTRRKKINHNDKDSRVDFVDPSGDKWQEFTVFHPKVQEWMKITGETDFEKSPWFECCADDLDWKQRVKLQGAAQRHIDHAISSTINLPENVSVEKVVEIYEEAWKQGLKGITVYRKNCRTGVLVEKKNVLPNNNAPTRPKELMCEVHHISVKGKKYFVLIGLFGDDNQPYEIFAGRGNLISEKVKKGKIIKVRTNFYKAVLDDETELSPITLGTKDNEESIARLVSQLLRHGVKIEYVIEQINKIDGEMTSFIKAISRTLKRYIKDDTKSGEKCECGSDLIYESGCVRCPSCGNSKCS